MSRSTIIIGNGLGMALDPNFFSLDTALEDVWQDSDCLTEHQKVLIGKCLAEQGSGERPKSEDDLDILHRVVVACGFLNGVGEGDIHWLNEDGQEFPEAIRKYITAVAWHFHHSQRTLSNNFLTHLSNFLEKSKSHIATLNYDNLLYQELIERELLKGYDGSLVDGFYSNGYDEENLKRKYDRDFGYYLHLHGSPLFIEKNHLIVKQLQGESEEIPTSHIVLTHVEHKPSVIDSSYLLKTYWRYFEDAVRESSRIIMFGYSGHDAHLNRIIKSQSKGKKLCVVEWSGTGDIVDRFNFWSNELKGDINLQHIDNILDFAEWENCDLDA